MIWKPNDLKVFESKLIIDYKQDYHNQLSVNMSEGC